MNKLKLGLLGLMMAGSVYGADRVAQKYVTRDGGVRIQVQRTQPTKNDKPQYNINVRGRVSVDGIVNAFRRDRKKPAYDSKLNSHLERLAIVRYNNSKNDEKMYVKNNGNIVDVYGKPFSYSQLPKGKRDELVSSILEEYGIITSQTIEKTIQRDENLSGYVCDKYLIKYT